MTKLSGIRTVRKEGKQYSDSRPLVFERKIFRSGRSLRVNIPEEIAKALNLNAGDTVGIHLKKHQMILGRYDVKWYSR